MVEHLTFGQWIKLLRARGDLTQEKLAEEVACAVQTVRAIESGSRRPSREMAARLADVLQVPDSERAGFLELARDKGERRSDAGEPVFAAAPAPQAGANEPPRYRPSLPLNTLIGRERELADLRALFADPPVRLVTMVGPGGIGKSRLAGQLAHDLAGVFTNGALWVPLAAVNQLDTIPLLVAEAMGEALRGTASPASQLRTLLAERELLLVLDNFEHLLDVGMAARAVDLIEQLMVNAERVRLLVTSRERLRLNVERIFEVDGLAAPELSRVVSIEPVEAATFDSVILFLERARQVDRQFALNATNCADVARVCALLQGMPLGVELAASWVRLLTPREIADEISSSIDFLSFSDRGADVRHRSIRAVFDHSWMLLEEEERRALAPLAIFTGGFDRAAARAVAGVSLPVLASLVDKSLVRVASSNAGTSGGATRYDLHELLRRYLIDRLEESGALPGVSDRHFRHFLGFAERSAPQLLQPGVRQRIAAVEVDQANLRAALEWSLDQRNDSAAGARLAARLGRYWYFTEQWRDGRDWLIKAAGCADAEPLTKALVYSHLAELCHSLSEHGAAADYFARAIELWRQLDRPEELAWTLVQAGALENTTGRFVRAGELFDEAIAYYRSTNNQVRIAVVLSHSASASISSEKYAEAARLAEEGIALFRRLERHENLAVSLNLHGRALLGLGEHTRPIEIFTEALDFSQQHNSNAGVMWASLNLGLTYALAEEFDASRPHYLRALDGYLMLGKRGGILAVLDGLAASFAGSGMFCEAAELIAAAGTLRQEIEEQLTAQEELMRRRAVETCRQQMDERAWQVAWQQGCGLSLARAVELARATAYALDEQRAGDHA